ncbi:MAG TPA: 3'(2'),5'-bisphosphate nucleotidase CysQ [Steroidobacteraceae bacterium]|nr:3'(2'),5'-bisphosphate nucleotidase CysQ [Steroidobacteraceae bacterium]
MLLDAPQRAALLRQVVAIAERAGEAILEVYGSVDVRATIKSDASPVTAADLRANQLIVDALRQLAPSIPILSEESAIAPFATRRSWPLHWLVDPLDGTKEFLKRNGEFTVNIALIQQHVPLLGVVHIPVTNTTYSGIVGTGAWRRHARGELGAIQVKVPAPAKPRVLGSRSHRGHSLDAFLAALGDYQLVTAGSSLKFCLLAEGSADLYPRMGPTSEWDTAAGQAVLEAAGGRVVTFAGQALRYNLRDDLLNPEFLALADMTAGWLSLVTPHD